MLFIDLVNSILIKMRQEPISDLSTDNTTKAYMAQIAANRALARVWNFKPWSFKRRTDTLSLSSGTDAYVINKRIGEIYSVKSSAYPYKITAIPKHLFDLYIPNPTSQTNPEIMILADVLGASQQPSSASQITVVSSSASDTSGSVLIKGLVSGQEDYEAVALNGTTSAVSSKSFTQIDSITKSATTVGRITLTSNSGAVTNAVMAPNEKTLKYKQATFYPEPASSITITISHFMLPPFLTHKWEDTEIPERWNYVLEQWGFALALQAQGQDQLTEFNAHQQLAIKMLEEDMASEEVISIEEPMVSVKAGDGGHSDRRLLPPSGTEFVL